MKDRIENKPFTDAGSHFSDAIVVTDADGLIEWTNHAFHLLCGYSKKEVLGSRPGDFLQGENTNPETVRALRDARVKGEYINTEILNYHKNGHPYWVSISITPIRDDDDALKAYQIQKPRCQASSVLLRKCLMTILATIQMLLLLGRDLLLVKCSLERFRQL